MMLDVKLQTYRHKLFGAVGILGIHLARSRQNCQDELSNESKAANSQLEALPPTRFPASTDISIFLGVSDIKELPCSSPLADYAGVDTRSALLPPVDTERTKYIRPHFIVHPLLHLFEPSLVLIINLHPFLYIAFLLLVERRNRFIGIHEWDYGNPRDVGVKIRAGR